MKNRIKNSVFLFVLFLIIGIVFKNIYISLSSVLISIVYYKIQYLLLKNEKKKVIALKRRMFPSMVKKLLILLRTNNTYISLNKLLDFTDNPIKKYLIEMIQEIDLDKSVKPYLNFAKKMEFVEAYQVMIMLYTFSEKSTSKSHLSSLEAMIFQLYNNEIDDVIERKKRLMWMYPNFTILTMMSMIFALSIFMLLDVVKGVSFVL